MLEKLKTTYKGKKVFVSLLMLFFAVNAYTQSSKNALSFEFTPSFGYRFLVADDKGNFQEQGMLRGPEFTKNIWDSAESSVFAYSFNINYIRKLNSKVSVAAGLGYSKMGKKYTTLFPTSYYQTNEGTMIPLYTNETIDLYTQINYISLPVSVQYHLPLNEKFGLIGSTGIIPMYAVNWSQQVINFSPNQIPITSNYSMPVNRFVISTEATLGINYRLNEKLEFQLSPSYVQQITPGVIYWKDLHQFHYNLGLKVGAKINL